jgi:hypothetical protein
MILSACHSDAGANNVRTSTIKTGEDQIMSNKENLAEQQARTQLASICDMVAALECDYDRLQELRDARDEFEFDGDANGAEDGPGYANNREAWAGENPEDAAELAELEAAAGDCEDADDARQRIDEDPLSIEIRSGWESLGAELTPSEFKILLCTGGPHAEIRGDLDEHGSPSRPRLMYSDWGVGLTELVRLEDHERDALQAYCECFCFDAR